MTLDTNEDCKGLLRDLNIHLTTRLYSYVILNQFIKCNPSEGLKKRKKEVFPSSQSEQLSWEWRKIASRNSSDENQREEKNRGFRGSKIFLLAGIEVFIHLHGFLRHLDRGPLAYKHGGGDAGGGHGDGEFAERDFLRSERIWAHSLFATLAIPMATPIQRCTHEWSGPVTDGWLVTRTVLATSPPPFHGANKNDPFTCHPDEHSRLGMVKNGKMMLYIGNSKSESSVLPGRSTEDLPWRPRLTLACLSRSPLQSLRNLA